MLDIDHVVTLRFKMCVAFIVYQLCDKDRLAGVRLEEFIKRIQTNSFSEKLFCTLAKQGVNKNNFLGHTITQMVVDELEVFYKILSGEN